MAVKRCAVCGGELKELSYMADGNGNIASAVLQNYGAIGISGLRLASCVLCGVVYAVPSDRLTDETRIAPCDTSASSAE